MEKSRILLIDDDPAVASAIGRGLTLLAGYEVRTELDGRRAIEIAREFRPQLILLDVQAKGWTGPDVAAALGREPDLKTIPVAFLTAVIGQDESGGPVSDVAGRPIISKTSGLDGIAAAVRAALVRPLGRRGAAGGGARGVSLRVFSKLEIATAQIETALELHEQGRDLLAVITLAGAAEEILGKMVLAAGGKPSLQADSEEAQRIMEFLDFGMSVGMGVKHFADRANRARNALKHLDAGGDPVELDPEDEAVDMLDRAISNYWLLREDLTPRMGRFVASQVDTANAHTEEPHRDAAS